MIALPVIAIFDVGKTNKKFFLLDEKYKIVFESSENFKEIFDEEGDACDDIFLITHWVEETLDKALKQKEFDIKAVNFSAYGASLVYINSKGKVLAPLYNYLKAYPEKLKKYLYKKYGGEVKISCETASPVLGSLNSGMQLYRLKNEKPELYNNIKFALHFPQYLSYIITKKAVSDITSLGCHTQLWNFEKHKYHDWVTGEQLVTKLAPLLPSYKTKSIILQNKKLKVGYGLHDSSAALIPYLAVFKEPFILISTGTWCISLNPFNNIPLTKKELKNDCLCYMEYRGKPVKASRLFAGNEHEQQVKRIAEFFKVPSNFYKKINYNASVIEDLRKRFSTHKKQTKNKVDLTHSSFVKKDFSLFNNYEEAYHCLIMDIMEQQFFSTQLVIKGSDVKRIFVDGGFGNNSIYMHLLSQAFENIEVFAASVAQATAMGAALSIHNEWNKNPVPADMVKLKYYKAS